MKQIFSLTLAVAILFGMNSCNKAEADTTTNSAVAVKSTAKENSAAVTNNSSTNQLSTENTETGATLENTSISFDKEVHDFGTIQEGEIAKTVFKVTNSGENTLFISKAQGSCGCTVPDISEYKDKPIEPGESIEVDVEFNSKGRGGFFNILSVIKDYFSLVKFSHTIFAMPFAIIGYFLALKQIESKFQPLLFLFVILCMVFGRNAAMAFNRLVDEKYDRANPRTASREIPSGKLKRSSALAFVIINCLLFIGTTFFINRLCLLLSPIVLAIILGYSYTKRFTPFSHIVLGLGLAIAPIGFKMMTLIQKTSFSPFLLSLVERKL